MKHSCHAGIVVKDVTAGASPGDKVDSKIYQTAQIFRPAGAGRGTVR